MEMRFEESWSIRKPAVAGAGGLIASQNPVAAEAGAEVLASGGNAVDAAVAASFACCVGEPWMSGMGGGGYMIVRPPDGQAWAVDFGMVAPEALDPRDYPIVPGGGARDLFYWPAVVGDRNLKGYHAVAVPGHVAGMAAALERFGTRSWQASLAPAIARAEVGLSADWYATLMIAAAARDLAQDDAARSVYLPDGLPPVGEWGAAPPNLPMGGLADTLKRLAAAGPRDFYEGEIAAALIADMGEGGSRMRAEDLARYRATIAPAESYRYRDSQVHGAPGLTAGPTLRHAFSLLENSLRPGGALDGESRAAHADALFQSYARRLATMGDAEPAPACTTHISVVDKNGMLVSLTQTLLSVFGARVVGPRTGILMNNGVMWFDPEPGRPNSIAGGKRPLSNMCPTIVERGDGFRFAIGASGGRRIMPAVFQLISYLVDFRMGLDAAFHTPRIDVSGRDTVVLDSRIDANTRGLLAGRFKTTVEAERVFPALYACPNAVGSEAGSKRQIGACYVPSPWARVRAA